MATEYSEFAETVLIQTGGMQAASGPWPYGALITNGVPGGFQATTTQPYAAGVGVWDGIHWYYHADPTQVRNHLATPDGESVRTQEPGSENSFPVFEKTGLNEGVGFYITARAYRTV
jgi:hypothetical protein